jgi:hypothetical protein
VLASNSAVHVRRTSSARLRRAIIRIAGSDVPPNAKKSSVAPTRETPSTSAMTVAIVSSSAPSGATYVAASDSSVGRGSALRSTFPFGVCGSASSGTMTDGTM